MLLRSAELPPSRPHSTRMHRPRWARRTRSVEEDQPRDPLRVHRGCLQCDQGRLLNAHHRRSMGPSGVEHGYEIGHMLVQTLADPVRASEATAVDHDQPTDLCELFEPIVVRRVSMVPFDVGRPAGEVHEIRWSATHHLEGDARVVQSRVLQITRRNPPLAFVVRPTLERCHESRDVERPSGAADRDGVPPRESVECRRQPVSRRHRGIAHQHGDHRHILLECRFDLEPHDVLGIVDPQVPMGVDRFGPARPDHGHERIT